MPSISFGAHCLGKSVCKVFKNNKQFRNVPVVTWITIVSWISSLFLVSTPAPHSQGGFVAPPIKKWSPFSHFPNRGWPCDLLWPLERGGNDVGLVLNLLSALILGILSSHSEYKPSPAYLIMKTSDSIILLSQHRVSQQPTNSHTCKRSPPS